MVTYDKKITFDSIEIDEPIFCSVLICFNQKNQVLLVSRRNNHSAWGLPGGKLDEGENAADCAVRETFEETGYRVSALCPVLVMKDDHGHVCMCYMGHVSDPIDLPYGSGESDLLVKWDSPDVLLNSSPFAKFNEEVLKSINYIK